MTATYRLKGIGWLAVCVIVALGFYLVSLQVAVERGKLASVNRSIIQAHRDIRSLETEFSTRSNLAQLERWNGEVLALTAPTPDQYIHSEAQLASLNFRSGTAKVEMAALVIPSLPTMAPPPDATPAPVSGASARPVADHAAAPARAVPARVAAPVQMASVDRARTEAMAMLDRKLLSDSTLGDLRSRARAETASLR